MTAHESGPPVSVLFAALAHKRYCDEQGDRSERRLMASWHRLNLPFAAAWQMAGDRLREERLMGLHPERRSIALSASTEEVMAELVAAAAGAHVTVTDGEGRAVVMVSAQEHSRLLLDRYLLAAESELPGVRRING